MLNLPTHNESEVSSVHQGTRLFQVDESVDGPTRHGLYQIDSVLSASDLSFE